MRNNQANRVSRPRIDPARKAPIRACLMVSLMVSAPNRGCGITFWAAIGDHFSVFGDQRRRRRQARRRNNGNAPSLHKDPAYARAAGMVSSTPHPRPAPLACIECRAKHLKCDGTSPRCGRCAAEGLRCVYKPSRRGYGRRNAIGKTGDAFRREKTPDAFGPSLTPSSGSPGSNGQTRAPFSPSMTTGHTTASEHHTFMEESGPSEVANPAYPLTPPSLGLQGVDTELFINSYYVHFHPAHPLLVPRQYLARQQYPDYLQWTICFIAQHYGVQQSGNHDFEGTFKVMLAPDKDEMTVSRVQALVLYAIVLHSLHRPQEALGCTRRACQIANAMGLNRPDFASLNAAPGSVEEESIRRTWWELYVVEAYLSALHRQPSLLSSLERSYPLLPTFEESYAAGTCDPDPPSLAQFEDRAFVRVPERRIYSSYSYRIEAIRIIRRVQSVWEDQAQPDAVQVVDSALASWKYYLPGARQGVADDLGDIDPLFFQAHFFVHSASILLHFPRSDLPAMVPSAAEIACVASHAEHIPGWSHHTVKAIAASKEISNLAANLPHTDSCSPFFICALILASIVQLAGTSIEHQAYIRERIGTSHPSL